MLLVICALLLSGSGVWGQVGTRVPFVDLFAQRLPSADESVHRRFDAYIHYDQREDDAKQKLRGYFNMTMIDYDSAVRQRDWFPGALAELARYMRNHTQIYTRIRGGPVRLSDPAIFKVPFLYLTGNRAPLKLSDEARENLGAYLRGGGFLFAEDIRHTNATTGDLEGEDAGVRGTLFDRQFKALMADPKVLGRTGAAWRRVPLQHPLYHCFWSFSTGPPLGGAPAANVFDLEMLELRGRVAVIFSDLNISWFWGDPLANGRERGLQFGVNLIVFALTQSGGMLGQIPINLEKKNMGIDY